MVDQHGKPVSIRWNCLRTIFRRPKPKKLLMALSADHDPKPFSKDFQLTYGIGPSSSIKASLDSLVKKGILYKTIEGKYQFSDTFMPCWIDYIGDKKQGW